MSIRAGEFRASWSEDGSHRGIRYTRFGDKMSVEVKRMIAKAMLREVRAMRAEPPDPVENTAGLITEIRFVDPPDRDDVRDERFPMSWRDPGKKGLGVRKPE